MDTIAVLEQDLNKQAHDYRLLGDSHYRTRKEYDEHKTECASYQTELEKKVKDQSLKIDQLVAANGDLVRNHEKEIEKLRLEIA